MNDSKTDEDILSMMQDYDPHSLAYPEQPALSHGSHKVVVSAAQSPQDFYVTLYGTKPISSIYGKKLMNLNACELKCPSPGNVCIVCYHGKFYRAKYLKRLTPSMCEVLLVDLGIVCKTNHQQVKVMVEALLRDAPSAYHCALLDESDFDSDYFKDENFPQFLNNHAVIHVKEFKDQKHFVKVLAVGQECDALILNAQLENFNAIILDECDRDVCQISYVSSVNNFTIQQISKKNEMEDAIKQWQHIIANIKKLSLAQDIKAGNRYIMKDKWNLWIRVELVVDEKGIEYMRNIDDGNLVVLHECGLLYDAPADVLLMKPFGILCTLPCHVKKHHDQEASEFLMHHVGKDLTYKLMVNRSGLNTIKLYDGDKSLVKEMEKLNFVKRHAVLVSNSGFISHIESLREFYVHQEEDGKKMRAIIQYAKTYQQDKVKDPWKNMIVMARHKPDNAWNRARILGRIERKFQVQFIDIGDKAILPKKELGLISDPWVYKSAPLAFKCGLDLPDDLKDSQAALNCFNSFAFISLGDCKKLRSFIDSTEKLSRKVDFKFIRVEKDLSSIITILDKEEKDLLDDILPLCEKRERVVDINRTDAYDDDEGYSLSDESDFDEIYYEKISIRAKSNWTP